MSGMIPATEDPDARSRPRSSKGTLVVIEQDPLLGSSESLEEAEDINKPPKPDLCPCSCSCCRLKTGIKIVLYTDIIVRSSYA